MVRVLLIAGALLVVAQLHRLGGGVISSELHRTFALGAADIGLVMGAMFFASAVVQVPIGIAFDRFGVRLTVSATMLIALIGSLVFGLSGGAVSLAVGRFLIGTGFAGVVTAVLLLTMRWAPPERYASVAATVMAIASALGGVLATAPLAFTLRTVGWTWTFFGISLATALGACLFFLVVRNAPAGAASGLPRESLGDSLDSLRAVLGDPELRRVLAMASCAIAPFSCIGGLWAGPYLQSVHGLGPGQASYVLLGMIAVFNLGTFAYGPLDRWLGSRRLVVLGGAAATTIALATLALWPGPSLWQAIFLFHLVAFAAPFYVTLTAHSREFVPLERAGRVLTTLNLFALSSAFGAQWLTGLLVALPGGDSLGTEPGFRLAFGFVVLMLLGAITIYYRAPERPAKRLVPTSDRQVR